MAYIEVRNGVWFVDGHMLGPNISYKEPKMRYKPGTQEIRNFVANVMPDSFLKNTVVWIGANLDPEDVFDDDALENWALNSGFIRDDR